MTITRRHWLTAGSLAAFTACRSRGGRIALLGATLLDGTGADPLADAVVVVDGARVLSAGGPHGTNIPAGAPALRLPGKYILPDLVDVTPQKPVEPHYTLEEFTDDANTGEPIVFGIPADSAILPADLLEKLHSTGTAVAPMLARVNNTGSGQLARANVKTMLESGIRVAVASGDHTFAGTAREVQALAASGAAAVDVLSAATRGGAAALRTPGRTGMLRAGDRADLLVLPGNPLRDFSVLNRVEKVMRGGAWKEIV